MRGAAVAAFVQAGGQASKLDDVALGVTEACASAVEHSAVQTEGQRRIEIRAWVEDDLFVVQVCDRAAQADSFRSEGDLGMRLIEQIAEADVATRESGGTELRLAFPMH
jgi:anti-sigma regulatory factor (Ser/Thr protein kinase)